MKTLLGFNSIHLEPAVCWEKLILYCKKQETRLEGPWEEGDPVVKNKQAKEKDSISRELISGQTNLKEVALNHPGQIVSNGTGFLRLLLFKETRYFKHLKVFLLVGQTGRGKSLGVRKIFKNAYILADNKNPWADGYSDQRELVIEEFGPGMMNINTLKRILDSYAVSLPVKGGFVNGTFDTVIITSNNELESWYPGAGDPDIAALARRISVYHFDNDDDRKRAFRDMLLWRNEREQPLQLPAEAQKIVDIIDEIEKEIPAGVATGIEPLQSAIKDCAQPALPIPDRHNLSQYDALDPIDIVDLEEFNYIS